MEILGSTFDDSVFCEVRDRVSVSLSSYNAKLCEPEVRVSLQCELHWLTSHKAVYAVYGRSLEGFMTGEMEKRALLAN